MSEDKKYNEEEWSNRVNLAACYHLADYFNMSDIIWNHITAKTSSKSKSFLHKCNKKNITRHNDTMSRKGK